MKENTNCFNKRLDEQDNQHKETRREILKLHELIISKLGNK